MLRPTSTLLPSGDLKSSIPRSFLTFFSLSPFSFRFNTMNPLSISSRLPLLSFLTFPLLYPLFLPLLVTHSRFFFFFSYCKISLRLLVKIKKTTNPLNPRTYPSVLNEVKIGKYGKLRKRHVRRNSLTEKTKECPKEDYRNTSVRHGSCFYQKFGVRHFKEM